MKTGPAFDSFVEMNQQFHDFFPDIFLGASQFQQDWTEEFPNDTFQLIVGLGAADSQENSFK